LSQETGLFNLRVSSDAPNLQVENEETIEALSARTKALLDGIQQRFLFARSLRAHSYRSMRFARFDDRPLFCSRELTGTHDGTPHGAPLGVLQPGAAMSPAGVCFSPSAFISFLSFSRTWRYRRAGVYSIAFKRSMRACVPARSVFENNSFSRFSRPKSVGNDNALSRVKASGDQQ
jgi:hypothetical protein